MPVGGFGPSCSCGCGRPARELGGLSTACWMGLTPLERAVLQWEHSPDTGDGQATQPFDSAALALELLWRLPAVTPPERPYSSGSP